MFFITLLINQGAEKKYRETLTRCAANKNWVPFERSCGKFKDFLLRHPDYFSVDSSGGNGFDNVQLKSVWKPLENLASDRRTNIELVREKHWQTAMGPNSPLMSAPSSHRRKIFDIAFNKCVRLTIRISYVLFQTPRSHVMTAISNFSKYGSVYLFKDNINRGKVYSETYCTIFSRGNNDIVPLFSILDAMEAGHIACLGRPLRTSCVGYGPPVDAVFAAIDELILMVRDGRWGPAPQVGAAQQEDDEGEEQEQEQKQEDGEREDTTGLVSPVGGSFGQGLSFPADPQGESTIEESVVPEAELAPLEPAEMFPREVEYHSLHDPVVDPQSEYMLEAVQRLQERGNELRKLCQRQRSRQSSDDDEDDEGYTSSRCGLIEWSGDESKQIGFGSEANIYMGLMSEGPQDEDTEDGSVPPEPMLVAVKVCYPGVSPYDNQELDLYVSLKRTPGVVRYHKGFKKKAMGSNFNVLVQDLGVCSLAALLEGDENVNIAPRTLREDEKFKTSKAVCMAVRALHNGNPPLAHRDVRPENVLIMVDGTIALTDFGLARRAPRATGTSVYDKNRLTTCQPWEVQRLFADNSMSQQNIPVTHAGDVFMLGLVLAYVHNGVKAFDNDQLIMDKAEPKLCELDKTNPWLHHLLTCMLSHEAKQRPSIDYVLKHPYFLSFAENFDTNLIRRVENVLVCDYRPVDNTHFRFLETLLAPIEAELKIAETPWTDLLPAVIPKPKVPVMDFSFDYLADGASPEQRQYPIPLVARLVKWIRNFKTHAHGSRQLETVLRRSKADVTGNPNDAYAHVADFFKCHPAIQSILPRIWQSVVHSIGKCEVTHRQLRGDYEAATEKYEQDVNRNKLERDTLLNYM